MRKRPYYDSAQAPYRYEGAILEAIHRFKYGSRDFLAQGLGPLLAGFVNQRFEAVESGLIMPIPLHPKRVQERGFNQSLLLARHVARALQMELDFLTLRRVRYTPPQASLARKERRQNVRGAFELIRPDRVKDRVVLLVDDVVTTGHTLDECARELRTAGAAKVFGFSLARAGR